MAGARGHRRCHQALSCPRVQPTGVLTQHPTRGSTRGGSGRGCCAGTPADRIVVSVCVTNINEARLAWDTRAVTEAAC